MSKSSVAVACFLPGRVKDLSALLYSWLLENWLPRAASQAGIWEKITLLGYYVTNSSNYNYSLRK